jgi:hypothetical protein
MPGTLPHTRTEVVEVLNDCERGTREHMSISPDELPDPVPPEPQHAEPPLTEEELADAIANEPSASEDEPTSTS